MNYYNVLLEDAKKSIIVIEHKDVYRFVTCCSKYCDFEIIQNDDIDSINVYDMYMRETRNLPLVEIMRHYHYDLNNLQKNDEVLLQSLKSITDIIARYCSQITRLSPNQLYNHIIKPQLIDIYNPNQENCILDFLSYTDFTLSIEDATRNIVPEHKKNQIIASCKILINKKIEEITLELNELKQQSDNSEDHEDIDTIIQMYRDVADEVDYSNCKTLDEYLRVWPTLLLPLPEKIDKFIYKISKLQHNSDDTTLVDFMSIVDNSLTYSEMKELLDELRELQPQYETGRDKVNLTPFKEYLKYKLNNEHK
jgi:hypothetical protein